MGILPYKIIKNHTT